MNNPSQKKKPYRKRHLFSRSVMDVVKEATKPLMTKQGKLYSALLRDWPQIVGTERASVTRPERLQFPTDDTSGAILHLSVRPSVAPELTYIQEQLLEQCARYFGYRAITRIVIHATHTGFTTSDEDAHFTAPKPTPTVPATPLPTSIPNEIRSVLERISTHLASPSDKKS